MSEEPRVSRGEAAYRQLKADIVSCRRAPGERFTERQLTEETGMGLSPLREALTRLDHDGLVRTLPRKGYQVTPLTVKSIDDLFVVWRLIGPELVRCGVLNATAEQLARAQRGFDDLFEIAKQAAGHETALTLVTIADETFAVLAEAADNTYLSGIFDRLMGDIARVWAMILAADPAAMLPEQQVQLPGADADAAAESTRRYITAFHERVLAIVSRWPSVRTSEVTYLPAR